MYIQSPIVSVIIIAGDDNKHILETINSVRKQTFTNFEVLICHSGQFPYSSEWLEGQKDCRLRLLIEEDLDKISILNLAVRQAKGKYIAFLKAGDLWHPNKLQKQLFHLENCPAIGLIHSWLNPINEANQLVGKTISNKIYGWVEGEILERNQVGFSSVVVRQECFEMVGLFNSDLPRNFDWDMWIRLSRCYEFMVMAESLVYQRQIVDPTKDSWLNAEQDFQAAIEQIYQNVPERLLTLKARSYGYASISLAWQVIQNKNADPTIAYHYCRQALEHCPRVSFSQEFLQLSMAVATLHWEKSDRNLRLLSLIQTTGSWLKIIIQKYKTLAHLVLNWMLEEELREGEGGTRKARQVRNEG